jgi:uncharacterized protein YceH (UPF0502 family)
MHLLSGPIDMKGIASRAEAAATADYSVRVRLSELTERVGKLEAEVAALRELLQSLT